MESDDSRRDAAHALALASSARSSLARRVVTPWWYHPALGLLTGGLVLAVQMESSAVLGLAVAAFTLGLFGLSALYRRRTGLWVSGFRPARARRWALLQAAVNAGCVLGAAFVPRAVGAEWLGVVLAVVAVLSTILLGRRFDEDLVAEIRTGPTASDVDAGAGTHE